jgi:hypothetical protein
METCNINK